MGKRGKLLQRVKGKEDEQRIQEHQKKKEEILEEEEEPKPTTAAVGEELTLADLNNERMPIDALELSFRPTEQEEQPLPAKTPILSTWTEPS